MLVSCVPDIQSASTDFYSDRLLKSCSSSAAWAAVLSCTKRREVGKLGFWLGFKSS
jgi:hypothetical protein